MDNESLNAAIDSADSPDLREKYLTFWCENQLFGVSIENIVQIVGMQEITEVPDYPSHVKGIMNLRGSVIPVIDMRLRLGKLETSYNDRTCIVIVKLSNSLSGFIVDKVDEVTDITDSQISPPPTLSTNEESRYLTGVARIEEHIVLLMDAAQLVNDIP